MSLSAANSLFWIALGALFVPMISRRIRFPSAVGELIYGMIFGAHFLNIITQDKFIEFMAHLGFAILMFSAGMEIDFAPIRRRGSKLLGTAWLWTILTAACAVGGYFFLDLGLWAVLAVCSVSIGLASVLLREKALLGAPIGQVILACGLVGESASILGLAIFDIHFRVGLSTEFYISVAQFAGIFLLAYILIRIFRFMIWWAPDRVAGFIKGEDPLELGVRLAVALLFIFLAASVRLGVEDILGAFIAGSLYGFIFQERETIAEKISAMGQGFFVPFFFIVVGSHFDPLGSFRAISSMTFVKLLALSLIVKIIPSFAFLRVGLRFREMLAAGLLLSAPLTLTVAVAEVGARLGAVPEELLSILILVAIVNGLACPFIARAFLPGEKADVEEG